VRSEAIKSHLGEKLREGIGVPGKAPKNQVLSKGFFRLRELNL